MTAESRPDGIFEAEEVTAAWLAGRADEDDPQALQPMRAFRADPGAPYAQTFQVDLARWSRRSRCRSRRHVKASPSSRAPACKGCSSRLHHHRRELVLAAMVLEAAASRAPANDKQIVVPAT